MPMTESLRFICAAGAVMIYLAMCLWIARREIGKRRATARLAIHAEGDRTPAWRIVYASQTGTAEEIARHTAHIFHLAGVHVQLSGLSGLSGEILARADRILFIVSTYGEGDPPDNAAAFVKQMNAAKPGALSHLHYAMLALGDRTYTHFCGFGRTLNDWLTAQGAQSLFPLLEADRCHAPTLESWWQQLSHLAGTDDAPDWQGPAFTPWRLVARRLMNAGSQGNGIYHLEFTPLAGAALPDWESGDLVQIRIPDDAYPRDYSIASIPQDGRIHLLIRLHRHADDSYGAASGWLTQTLNIGDTADLRWRRHERFQLGENAARPLILIGNGSGIAGLRAHLKARALMGGARTWLIFGERNAACDFHYRVDIEAWHRAGVIEKLDAVFSRDQAECRYVQDRLLEDADAVRDWVNRGAAIYVCGSLRGMAAGVDDALTAILGSAALDELSRTGRYRRDVY